MFSVLIRMSFLNFGLTLVIVGDAEGFAAGRTFFHFIFVDTRKGMTLTASNQMKIYTFIAYDCVTTANRIGTSVFSKANFAFANHTLLSIKKSKRANVPMT
jgi:hypothetical protein